MYRERMTFTNEETLEYGRKSRFDDPLLSIEETLAKHAQMLEEYAIENLGGPIPPKNKYMEVASSESIDKRPELLRMLKAIENPKVKAILIVDVQRLSRGDLEDAGRLIRLIRYSNTCVITPMRTYDLRDEYDRDAFERELKKGNEYLEYYKKIQARGKLGSVKEGNYIGSVAPYGFNRVTKGKGKDTCHTLEENKAEADVVRMIFDWYCNENIGTTAICRRLEHMGIKTKDGKPHWKSSIIYSMLENVHYIGQVRWNWRKTVKIIEDQEIKRLRPKAKVKEYLVFEGKHDGIVSKELFERAKEIRGTKPKTRTDTTLKNPLSGLMYCKCGAKIGYNTYTKNGEEYAPPKLVCNNQVHCKTGSADFNDVIDYVCRSLKDCIEDFEVLVENDQGDSSKLHKKLIDNLEAKQKELEERELSQWRTQSDPNPSVRMPPHIFEQLNKELLAEKEEIKKALCEAYESLPQPVDYETKILKFTDALKALEDPNISAKAKNRYLKDVIERIEYERPPIVRITKKNAHEYKTDTEKGLQYHVEPYKIEITIKP